MTKPTKSLKIGYTKTRSQVIAIAEKTTTTATATESTTTETTSTTTTMKTTTTTAPATTTTTTTLANDIIDKEIEEESQSPEDTLYLDDEAKDDTEDGSTVEALPVSDREAARSDGSIGVISGVIVSLLAVVVIMTVLGVKLYRRRKSHQAIISYLQSVGHIEPLNLSHRALKKSGFRIKLFVTLRLPLQRCVMIFIVLIIVNIQERDDAMATNSFLEEAEYHISIIRDPGSLPLQTQKTLNSSDMVTNDTVLTVDEEEDKES